MSKQGYAKVESSTLQLMLNNPIIALASHWVFQSLLYMDPTERYFKIALDILITVGMAPILQLWFSPWISWICAFIFAHTLNFLFNGHVWGVLKHYGVVTHTFEDFCSYAQLFQERATGNPSIASIGIYGSVVREEWTPTSDLDVRMIRQPGLRNGVNGCIFVLIERSRSLVKKFPLDIYLLDSESALQRVAANERQTNQVIQNDSV